MALGQKEQTMNKEKITRTEKSRIQNVLRVMGDFQDPRMVDARLVGLGIQTVEGNFTYMGNGLMKSNTNGVISEVKGGKIRGFFDGEKPEATKPPPPVVTSLPADQLKKQAEEHHEAATAEAEKAEAENKAAIAERGMTEKEKLVAAIAEMLPEFFPMEPLEVLDQALGVDEDSPLSVIDQIIENVMASIVDTTDKATPPEEPEAASKKGKYSNS
jgi:hypothetical protein